MWIKFSDLNYFKVLLLKINQKTRLQKEFNMKILFPLCFLRDDCIISIPNQIKIGTGLYTLFSIFLYVFRLRSPVINSLISDINLKNQCVPLKVLLHNLFIILRWPDLCFAPFSLSFRRKENKNSPFLNLFFPNAYLYVDIQGKCLLNHSKFTYHQVTLDASGWYSK